MWTGRQFCRLPLAAQAEVQAEAGLVGFLSSCQPAALRDTARRMLAKSGMRSHLLHILSHVRGLHERKPLLSDFMVFVHSPRKSKREKKKASCLTSHNRKERILPSGGSGNEVQHPRISA